MLHWRGAAAPLPISAQAACADDNFVFHPEKNDGVVVDAVVAFVAQVK